VRPTLPAAAAVGVAVLLGSLPAAANGRFPASNQFVFSPTNQNLILLRATYGILPSTDNGATWSFLCEDALGLPANAYEDPSIGLTQNGNLIAGLSLGLNVSTDLGCDWNCQTGPLMGQSIADIAVRADDPNSVVALTSTYVTSDADTTNTYSQVFQTTDNGAHWAAVGTPIDPTVIVETLDVPKSDPTRIYVSGTRGFGVMRTASLFVWTTASNRWTESPIPQFDNTMEDSVYIGGVDPTNADRVYLRSSGLAEGGESRLFVTSNGGSDAGASFTLPMSATFSVPMAGLALVGELQGFALSQDGSKVYVGTKESGLWMASSSDLTFQQTNSHIHVQCLATRGTELWACSDAVSGFVAGVSADDGATFTSKLCSVTGLKGLAACSANDGGPLACMAAYNSSQCGASYDMLCTLDSDSVNGQCVPCDGGAPAAGDGGAGPSVADAGVGVKANTSSSSGCSLVVGGGGAVGALGGLAISALALRRRRKKTR
jgi:hypothetical protein